MLILIGNGIVQRKLGFNSSVPCARLAALGNGPR